MTTFATPNWKKVVENSSPSVLRMYQPEAAGWHTCRVGELVQKYPNVILVNPSEEPKRRSPKDTTLNGLGFRFYLAVREGNVGEARTLERAIRARVKRLVYNAARKQRRAVARAVRLGIASPLPRRGC